jgi:hypothetical protein
MSELVHTSLLRRSLAIIATAALTLAGVSLGSATAIAAETPTIVEVTPSQIGTTNVSYTRTAWDTIADDAFVPAATGFALDIENKPLGTSSFVSTGFQLDPGATTNKIRYQYYLGTGGIPALDARAGATVADLVDEGFSWDAYFPSAYDASAGAPSIDIQLEKELPNGKFQRTAAFVYVHRTAPEAGTSSNTGYNTLTSGQVRANSQPAVIDENGNATAVTVQTEYTKESFAEAFGDYTVVSFGPNAGRFMGSDNKVVFSSITAFGTELAFSKLDLDPATSTFSPRADYTTSSTIFLPQGATLDGNGHTISVQDDPNLAYGFKGAVVQNAAGTTQFDVTDLTINGQPGLVKQHQGGNLELYGVRFTNASGSITDSSIVNIERQASADNDGHAVRIDNVNGVTEREVSLDDVTITNFQKGGLIAQGNVSVEIANSTFGHGHATTPPNTIQISGGADANIHDNTIGGVQSTQNGDYRTSTSILASGAGTLRIVDNTITTSDAAVYIAGGGESTVFRNVITGPANPIFLPGTETLQSTWAVLTYGADLSAGANRISGYQSRYATYETAVAPDYADVPTPYTTILAEVGALDIEPLYAGQSAVDVEIVNDKGIAGIVSVFATVGSTTTKVGSVSAAPATGVHSVRVPVAGIPAGNVTLSASYAPAADDSEVVDATTTASFLFAAVDVALALNTAAVTYTGSPAVATVTVAPAGVTGTVQLFAGSEPIGAATAVTAAGKAVISIPNKTLTAGAHSITAVFTPTGDTASSFSTGTSAARVLVVSRAATTTGVTLSKASQTYNAAPATIIANVTKGLAGTVQFRVGGVAYGEPIEVSTTLGRATLPVADARLIAGGKQAITAVFSPELEGGYASSTAAAKTLTVTKLATTTAVKLGGTTQVFGATPVSVVATVTRNVDGAVQFRSGTTLLGGPVAVVHGATSTATLDPEVASTIAGGKASITAVFTPTNTAGYNASTAKAVALTVTKAAITVDLEVSGSSQAYGTSSPVDVTATAPAGVDGSVQFFDGSTTIGGPVAVDENGEAVASSTAVAFLPSGSRVLRAVFSPTATANFAAVTSPAATLAVTALVTTLELSTSEEEIPTTWTYGDTGLGTINAQATAGVPGKVQFYYATGKTWGAPLSVTSQGRASIALATLPAGDAIGQISAVFTPTNTLGRTSATALLTLGVVPNKATATITQSVPESVKSKSVITVTVGGVTGAPAPTGTVRVYYTATKFVTATIASNGTASATLPTIAKNTKLIIKSVYSGDLGYATVTSASVTRTAK